MSNGSEIKTPIKSPSPVTNDLYCLYVTQKIVTKNAIIVSFDFGRIRSIGDTPPETADNLDKKYPFILKQSIEAVESGIGVHTYGAIIQPSTPISENTACKLQIVPCGDISYLPNELSARFSEVGYLETDNNIDPALCEIGNVYTIGASDGT